MNVVAFGPVPEPGEQLHDGHHVRFHGHLSAGGQVLGDHLMIPLAGFGQVVPAEIKAVALEFDECLPGRFVKAVLRDSLRVLCGRG
jgi:hypothetical protein